MFQSSSHTNDTSNTSFDCSLNLTLQPFDIIPQISTLHEYDLLSFLISLIISPSSQNSFHTLPMTLNFEKSVVKIEVPQTLESEIDILTQKIAFIQKNSLPIFVNVNDFEVKSFLFSNLTKKTLSESQFAVVTRQDILTFKSILAKRPNVTNIGNHLKEPCNYLVPTGKKEMNLALCKELEKNFEPRKQVQQFQPFQPFQPIQQTQQFQSFFPHIKKENTRSWDNVFSGTMPTRQDSKTEIFSYCQHKYYTNYISKKFMKDPIFDKVRVNVRKLKKSFAIDEVLQSDLRFSQLFLTGSDIDIDTWLKSLRERMMTMRVRACSIPYTVKYQSLEELLFSSRGLVNNEAQKLIEKEAGSDCAVQVSRFLVFSKDVTADEIRFCIIYDRYISENLIKRIEDNIKKMFDSIKELVVNTPPDHVIGEFKKRGEDFLAYMETIKAVLVCFNRMDTKFLVAGFKDAIKELEMKLQTQKTDTFELSGSRSLLVKVDDNLVSHELSQLSNRFLEIEKKFKGKIKPASLDNSTLRLEAKSIQDVSGMKDDFNKLIGEVKSNLIQYTQEFPAKQYKEFVVLGNEGMIKEYGVKILENPLFELMASLAETAEKQWYWELKNEWIPFEKEHNELIEACFVDQQEVILDALVVESAGNFVFDFENQEVIDKIRGKTGTLIMSKSTLYEDYEKEGLKKVSEEVQRLVLQAKSNGQQKICIFTGDFILLHSEKILINTKTKQRFQIKRQLEVDGKPIEQNSSDKVKVEIIGLPEKIKAFLKKTLSITKFDPKMISKNLILDQPTEPFNTSFEPPESAKTDESSAESIDCSLDLNENDSELEPENKRFLDFILNSGSPDGTEKKLSSMSYGTGISTFK